MKNKTFEEFIQLVSEVRTLQKAYFKTRDQKTLEKCKTLERYLDNLLTVHKTEQNDQPQLF